MKDNVNDVFISLIRLGINHTATIPSVIRSWDDVEVLAERQGLTAIMVDGIESLPENMSPPKVKLLQLIGKVVQGYEYRYELCQHAIAELAAFYRKHDMKMMVLKGYVCSLDWPKPKHRPCGDIDIWLFGKQKDGDSLIESEKGIEIDKSHHHHTVYYWSDFMVENHYDFINVYSHKSNAVFELVLKELGQNDSHFVEINGERVYVPSPDLHALFLLKHMTSHFAAAEITIRHLLDWAFFVKAHKNEVDWTWLNSILERFGLVKMFNIINAICINDLGFNSSLFPPAEVDVELKERVLSEILEPSFSSEMPISLVDRVIWKYRRWRANGWKHKLCYKESMWSSFWYGVWGHILKPRTI